MPCVSYRPLASILTFTKVYLLLTEVIISRLYKIILKWISEKQIGRVWTRFIWLSLGIGCGLL